MSRVSEGSKVNKGIYSKIKLLALWILLFAVFGIVYIFTYHFAEPKAYDFMVKNVLTQKLPFDKYKQVYGSDDVVLIVIDIQSVKKYRWPWKRELYCDIFEYFTQYAKPKIVIHDSILVALDKDNPQSDSKYFKSVGEMDNFITGFIPSAQEWENKEFGKQYDSEFQKKYALKNVFDSNILPELFNSILPFPKPYFDVVKKTGIVITPTGAISGDMTIGNIPIFDSVLRNHIPIIKYKNAYYPSVGLEAFLTLNPADKILISKHYIEFPNLNYKIKHSSSDFILTVPVRFYKLYDNQYSHKYYSAIDIMKSTELLKQKQQPLINPEIFKDKIVVLGANVPAGAGLNDNKSTPVRGEHPGVDFQATIIDNIFHNDYLNVLPKWANFIITILGMLALYFTVKNTGLIKSVISAILLIFGYILAGIVCFYFLCVINILTPVVMFILTTIVAYTAKYASENRSKEQVKFAMGKYMSHDVMQDVVKNIDNLGLGGKKSVVTVLFADIRGFTSMSEKMSAQQVSEILNEYFSEMEPIITSYNGIINKFIGDAIMAVFGEPIQDEKHVQNAVKCGYAMLERVEKLRRKWTSAGKPEIQIGVGINTGEVFIGNIGSVNRMEYTVIGDTVNLASRLESYNKIYKTKMLISTSTYKKVKDIADVIKIPDVQIRGKANKMDIYEVLKVKLGN